jgi:methylphosphotriester-DNA--protein-cysteine methyltransferase
MVDEFLRDYRAANMTVEDSTIDANDVVMTTQRQQADSDRALVAVDRKYVASKNSAVFHKPDCRWAKNISAGNLVGYSSREEATNSGKRPCKTCKP